MDSLERFLPGIIESMRMDIERSGGNEVFWSGTAGPDGRICSVKVGSRGNSDSVVVNRGVAQQGQVLIHNHPNGIFTRVLPTRELRLLLLKIQWVFI